MYIIDNIDKLKKLINEALFEYYTNTVSEGINVDYDNNTVEFDETHDNRVVTSLQKLPFVSYTQLNDGTRITIYSIFKRLKINNNKRDDGNPLVYALKNENGWTFKTEEDRKAIENRIIEVINKIVSLYNVGFTLVIPSTNQLNYHLASLVEACATNCEICKSALVKMSANEVFNEAIKPGSKFYERYKNSNFQEKVNQLKTYINAMNQEGGKFRYHLIKDSDMRKTISNTLKLSSNGAISELSNKITQKDVLLIDDTISTGKTLIEAANILKDSFSPKSITALTLFSRAV